jgi:GNAT superfamily N-acetyltransferase
MEIVPFSAAYAPAFTALNRAWIERLFTIEPADLKVLNDPQAAIIDSGGQIFFAVEDGVAAGTAAAIHMGEGRYELAKMAVDPTHQGAGLGFLLGQAIVDWVRAQQAQSLFLVTNSSLQGAIRLYERLGFQHAPMSPGSEYARADVYMEIACEPSSGARSS